MPMLRPLPFVLLLVFLVLPLVSSFGKRDPFSFLPLSQLSKISSICFRRSQLCLPSTRIFSIFSSTKIFSILFSVSRHRSSFRFVRREILTIGRSFRIFFGNSPLLFFFHFSLQFCNRMSWILVPKEMVWRMTRNPSKQHYLQRVTPLERLYLSQQDDIWLLGHYLFQIEQPCKEFQSMSISKRFMIIFTKFCLKPISFLTISGPPRSHTGGSVILTTNGKNDENGTPFITLNTDSSLSLFLNHLNLNLVLIFGVGNW